MNDSNKFFESLKNMTHKPECLQGEINNFRNELCRLQTERRSLSNKNEHELFELDRLTELHTQIKFLKQMCNILEELRTSINIFKKGN